MYKIKWLEEVISKTVLAETCFALLGISLEKLNLFCESHLALLYVLFVTTNTVPVVFSACKTAVLPEFGFTLMYKVQYTNKGCDENGDMYEHLSDM